MAPHSSHHPSRSGKRQRTAALQDASVYLGLRARPQGFGVRLSSAALAGRTGK